MSKNVAVICEKLDVSDPLRHSNQENICSNFIIPSSKVSSNGGTHYQDFSDKTLSDYYVSEKLKKSKLEPSTTENKILNSLNMDNESGFESPKMDNDSHEPGVESVETASDSNKSRGKSSDSETSKSGVDPYLVKSTFNENIHESESKTNLIVQKSTRKLEESTKESEKVNAISLKSAISILESLNADISTSFEISRKDMYREKIPGSPSKTAKKMDSSTEGSPSKTAEKMGSSTEGSPTTILDETGVTENTSSTTLMKIDASTDENHCKGALELSCFNCKYFDNMDEVYYMQKDLLEVRIELWDLTKQLLKECDNFDGYHFEKIESILKRYEMVEEESSMVKEEFVESEIFFHLDPWDAIGALRISSQIMYFKYLQVENDKYMESFKLAKFIMIGLKKLHDRKLLNSNSIY
ncbi:hypothetical protein NPIL_629991 [Nephila pilipes]|uniref:Uncharacterized protein n=1 Tax=Nephila pilipes TaxID=299642 RepID=A0A8X6QWQ0_NEPPI|nr:hypothetical protein NPIL_629991 [Nephila pilipes]